MTQSQSEHPSHTVRYLLSLVPSFLSDRNYPISAHSISVPTDNCRTETVDDALIGYYLTPHSFLPSVSRFAQPPTVWDLLGGSSRHRHPLVAASYSCSFIISTSLILISSLRVYILRSVSLTRPPGRSFVIPDKLSLITDHSKRSALPLSNSSHPASCIHSFCCLPCGQTAADTTLATAAQSGFLSSTLISPT